jgi:hypothetical protein
MTERKGVDAEALEQRCCFMLTSNHLPLWIEPEDRRYYLIEVDHDGHATGPHAGRFAELVKAHRGISTNGTVDWPGRLRG